MAICQFFLQGRCKFGNSCRNEHPRDGQRQGGFGNSSWTPSGNQKIVPFSVDTIAKDWTPGVDKPIWPLTSYGPAKHEPVFISGLDESPEELRLKAVQALKSGTVNEYMIYEGEKIAAADQVYANARPRVNEAYEQASKISMAASAPSGGSVFGSGGHQSASSSAFGNATTPSAFGANPSSTTSSVFGKPAFGQTAPGQSAFGKSTLGQPAFGQSAFSGFGSSTAAPSAFGQPQQQTSSVFGQPQQTVSAFGQPQQSTSLSVFDQPHQTNSALGQPHQMPSSFGQPSQSTSVFGQPQQSGSAFGLSSQPTSSVFGQPQQQATSAFGQPSQPTSAFGQPQQGITASVFGQSSQPTSSLIRPATGAFGQSAFGSGSNSGVSTFGASPTPASSSGTSSGGGFSAFAGQKPSGFGAGAATTGGTVFGQPSLGTVTSAFGTPAPAQGNVSAFGSRSAFGGQNQTQTQTRGAFGMSAPHSSVFGTPSTSGVPSAFGGSGNTATASAFGAAPTSAFGSAPQPTTTSVFGTSTNTSLTPVALSQPTPSQASRQGPPDFANAKATYKPGVNKYDAMLPENYLQILPAGARKAFESKKFEWGNIPEWIPPKELR